MAEEKDVLFLCRRMKELREKNDISMEEMARRLGISNKSTISRIESGKIAYKNLLYYAEEYCKEFKMSKDQIDRFLRGDRIAIPDTSALLSNPQLIDELNKEYNKVLIPKNVIDELDGIKNKSSGTLAKKAWEIIRGISYGERVVSMEYKGDNPYENNDCKIIWIAEKAVEIYGCNVDIITNDTDYSAYLRTDGEACVKAIHLREYMLTKQNLTNMSYLMDLNEYYADTYDDVDKPTESEANAYIPLEDENNNGNILTGNTLIINAVRNRSVSLEQRKAKIKWLISCGADINKRDCSRRYFPPLSHAVQMGDVDMVEFLLNECGANPNIGSRNPFDAGKVRQKNEGNMPIMIVSYSTTEEFNWKKEKILKLLCNHPNISINQQDANGFTALIKASMNGNSKCRNILIAAGADTRIVDLDGRSAEDWWNLCLEYGPAKHRNGKKRK